MSHVMGYLIDSCPSALKLLRKVSKSFSNSKNNKEENGCL